MCGVDSPELGVFAGPRSLAAWLRVAKFDEVQVSDTFGLKPLTQTVFRKAFLSRNSNSSYVHQRCDTDGFQRRYKAIDICAFVADGVNDAHVFRLATLPVQDRHGIVNATLIVGLLAASLMENS